MPGLAAFSRCIAGMSSATISIKLPVGQHHVMRCWQKQLQVLQFHFQCFYLGNLFFFLFFHLPTRLPYPDYVAPIHPMTALLVFN